MKWYNIFQTVKILFGCSLIFTSCSEEVNFPLESTYIRMVVDGSITTDTAVHKVRLSTSGDALNNNSGFTVTNAVVTISDGTTVFDLHENSSEPGTYETEPTVYGIPGRTYTLQISNVDVNGDGVKEEYTASSFLPKENPIDSIQIKYQKFSTDDAGWLLNLFAQEIGGGRNFYLMKAYRNGKLVTDSAYECQNFADNTGFAGKYYDGFSVYYMNKNKEDEKLQPGDTVTLEMDGITEEYEQFLLGFVSEYNPKVPIFSGPSANIPTNIEPKEKAVGFFTAYSAERKSRVYKGE
jgi:hypothetical protein